MHSAVEQMLDRYGCKTSDDVKNALKEVVQEIALLGLSRSDFFDHAAFYGGTALRMFYGLDRFSEDLDFSLLKPRPDFQISVYCDAIRNELGAYGFEMEVTTKEKDAGSTIKSAFIKGGTLINMLKVTSVVPPVSGVHRDEILKIKIEVDVAPPGGAAYEVKYMLRPIPYSVRLFSPSSLFAGKLHAVLCRSWGGNRVKGRDLYDLVWYVSKEIPVHLSHLAERMIQTGHLNESQSLTSDVLINMMNEKFRLIDFKQAKNDVLPFVSDPRSLDLWSEEFFHSLTKHMSLK